MNLRKIASVLALCMAMTFLFSACNLASSSKSVGSNNLEDLSVTKIELSDTIKTTSKSTVKDVYYIYTSDSYSTALSYLKRVYAMAYTDEALLNKKTGLGKAIRWVSSDPNVISVSNGTVSYAGEKLPLKININKDVDAKGTYTIYAENFDGSVKSKPITIVLDASVETITKLSFENPDGTTPENGTFLFNSDAGTSKEQACLSLYFESPAGIGLNKQNIADHIKWVSSDPNIISVTSKPSYGNNIQGIINFNSEGVVDIYAETDDGRVQSNVITLAYGNQFNKEFLASDFAANYVLDHLRYKTKTSDYKMTSLVQRKRFFINGNRVRIGYTQFEDTSTVETKSTTFEGDEVTITGIIDTYTEIYNGVRFSFAVRFKCVPDSNYTSYELVKANYELPEYIIKEVGIED